MTIDDFRTLALDLPQAVESSHMGHPDFRVRGKIFATLWPDQEWGMVKLTPEEQGLWIRTAPTAFRPVKGAWGRRGCTNVILSAADPEEVRLALLAAWRNVAPRRLVQEYEEEA
jgi:hypothetical protein